MAKASSRKRGAKKDKQTELPAVAAPATTTQLITDPPPYTAPTTPLPANGAAKQQQPAAPLVDIRTYAAFNEAGADIVEAMAANMGEGASLRESDLTRVPIPTGAQTTWMIPDINDDVPAKEIRGVLVHQCNRGVLWGSDEPEEGALPILVTHDMKHARLISDPAEVDAALLKSIEPMRLADGTYEWEKLPQNQWGSGKGGNGKQAKEQRVLYILTEDSALPLIVIIQPGSLKGWREFIVAISKRGIPHYRAIICLTLEKATSESGVAYSQVVASLAGTLSREQGEQIQKSFTAPMRVIAQNAFAG